MGICTDVLRRSEAQGVGGGTVAGGGGLVLGKMGKAAASYGPGPRRRARSQRVLVEAAPATGRRLRSKKSLPSEATTLSSAAATVSSEAATVFGAAQTVPRTEVSVLRMASAKAPSVNCVNARVHANLLEELEAAEGLQAAEGAGESVATVSSIAKVSSASFVARPGACSSDVPWVSAEESVLRRLAKGVVADLPDEKLGRVLANMQHLQEAADAGQPMRIGSIYTGSDLAKHAWDEFVFALLGPGGLRLQTEHTMGSSVWRGSAIISSRTTRACGSCSVRRHNCASQQGTVSCMESASRGHIATF